MIPFEIVDGIGLPDVGLGSGWAVAVVFVFFLMTGRLMTRRSYDDGLAAADREIERVEHDRQEWRTESRIKDAQIAEKNEQLRHMGEVGRTVEAILGALQRNASKEEAP